MRKIDWEGPLSDEDVTWLRQAGFVSEAQIVKHQAQFDAEVPDVELNPDGVTRSALDPAARVADPVEGMGAGSPVLVVPTEEGADDVPTEDDGDDYDQWKVNELEAEVKARDEIADKREDVSFVKIDGTGKNQAVTKGDLIKGLRLWDQENPGALSE